MTRPVPFGDLAREAAAIAADLETAFARVVRSGWFVLGREVEAFEAEFAAWIGAGTTVGCASGTDAITLALKAVGVGRDDEVITAANTCGPTAVGIENAGARLRLVDADPATLMLDAGQLAAAITPRTRAIVPVHLYGHAADMDAIGAVAARHGVPVVEDCAQSHGSEWNGRRTGTFGAIAAFSFYPSKNLGALGDAGACLTADAGLDARLRRLRNYGQADRYTQAERGLNSRLDEVQAALLRAKLPHLTDWNARRAAIAHRYAAGLASCPDVALVAPPPAARSVYHLFAIRHPRRDALQAFLRERGVATYVHDPVPVHLHPAYADLGYARGAFPVAERACAELLSLPMHAFLSDDEVDAVCEAVWAFQ
ncbi:MAG: DegT/DnrJ/EryC1/StrS family aminotransferase [Deltaproteobacteria bacterium]|nr:DegT/DnrJ/EryC1/StrS family aminotransferase [Deltaproteobacteria bacterium]